MSDSAGVGMWRKLSSRRKPLNRSQRGLRRPTREGYSTRVIEFESDGDTCVGTLYTPEGAHEPPVVVMAPGLGMWRTFGLPAVAERFAEAGYAAFAFDFRGIGDSEGDPRGAVSPQRQIDDYEAAMSALIDVPDVDDNRFVLWGHSLSGGHVLSVAADNFRVAAVVAVNPFVDGRGMLLGHITEPAYLLKAVGSGIRDFLGHRFGFGTDVDIVDYPGDFAVVTAPGARRALLDLVDRESRWENRTPARVFLSIPRYRPVSRVEEIRCPTLVIGSADDEVSPVDKVESAAKKIDGSTYVRLPADHFSVLGEDLDAAVGHQIAFLDEVVGHR